MLQVKNKWLHITRLSYFCTKLSNSTANQKLEKIVEPSYNVLKYDPKRRDYIVERMKLRDLFPKKDANFKQSFMNQTYKKDYQYQLKIEEDKGSRFSAQSLYYAFDLKYLIRSMNNQIKQVW